MSAGQRVFGENRVQEALARWAARRDGLELRLIGPLQTNKARDARGAFRRHRDPRPGEAGPIVWPTRSSSSGRSPRLYVQVNTGEEPQKAGVAPAEADAFIAAAVATSASSRRA